VSGGGVASVSSVRGDRVSASALSANGRWSNDPEWIAALIRETEGQLREVEEERRILLQQLQGLNGLRQ
jgi:hypothetical protein